MAEKKEAEAKTARTPVYLNGLSPNMVQPAYKREKGKIVRDAEDNPVLSDNRVIVSIYDVNETRYSFECYKNQVVEAGGKDPDKPRTGNVNVVLYEEPGSKLNVTIHEKGSDKYDYARKSPTELHDIQEAKHRARMMDKGKEFDADDAKKSHMVWLNGINKDDSRQYDEQKNGKVRLTIWEPNAFEDGSPRRITFGIAAAHFHDVENTHFTNLSLINDAEFRGRGEPYRGAKLEEYESVTFTGEQIADAWKASQDAAKAYSKAAAAAAETDTLEPEAEQADELEA